MAIVNYDQNTQSQQQNTTDVLPNTGTSNAQSYASNGNPYGQFSSSENVITSQTSTPASGSNTQQSARKQNTGASSGSFTNVQSYVDKNKNSAQQLSGAASKTLTNTSDIAKENLNKAQQSFSNQVGAGSLQNKENALNEANTAFNEAANQQAATQQYNKANQAYIYEPKKPSEPITYIGKDGQPVTSGQVDAQSNLNDTTTIDNYLKDKNLARVIYGDGTFKDYNTQSEATKAMEEYNKANPGYYTYGNDKQLSTSNDRLADILNAQYKGPTDLSEAVGYDKAYNTVQDAAALQKQVLNAGNQGELLKRTFSTGQNEYSTGNELLDNLLLGQGQANQSFRDVAKSLGTSDTGMLADDLKLAQRSANQQAQQESTDLQNIRKQAREDLNTTATQRQQDVEGRLNDVVANWEKYPEYFRELFKNTVSDYNSGTEGKAAYDKFANSYNSAKSIIDPITQKYQGIDQYSNLLNNVKSSQGIINQVDELRKIISDPASYANRDSNGSYTSSLMSARAKLNQLTTSGSYDNAQKTLNEANTVANNYNTNLDDLVSASNTYTTNKAIVDKYQPDYDKYSKFANFDPSKVNVNLSGLEAEALGIQGGEGLYKLLEDSIKGTSGVNTIENLFKTAQSDRNQLVSRDEQSQLNRLQQLAQLANDYGSATSGLTYNNKYINADLAGKQNATSALDMQNFKNLVQGAEKGFREDAKNSNITGSGWAEAKSGSGLGAKWAQAWGTNTQNLADVIEKGGGYRNMYSDEGVDNALLNKVIAATKGSPTFQQAVDDTGVVNNLTEYTANPNQLVADTLGLGNNSAMQYLSFVNPITNPITSTILSGLGLSFGSKGAAQNQAQAIADQRAQQDMINKLNQKIDSSGLRNQFNVDQNKDNTLLANLLASLDTTNL